MARRRLKVSWGDDAGLTAWLLLLPLLASTAAGQTCPPAAAGASPSSLNTLLGSIQIGDTYSFTREPSWLEGARRLAAAGARVHKFSLKTGRAASMADAIRSPELGYAPMLDLPGLHRFVFWAYPVNDTSYAAQYREYRDLASHLITRYAGTGKSFYIGHWEGDWSIRNDYVDPVIPEKVARFVQRLSAMQAAIDDAKRAHAALVGGDSGVKIWGYGEVNRVLKSMRDPAYKSFINQVVPHVTPPLDFISYSNWELEEEVERSADEQGPVLHAALDFIAANVPPKPCVPEPRVFVGEYGYFLRQKNCSALMAPPVLAGSGPHVPTTPEIMASRTLWHAANAVAWGSPLTLFWQMYSNEKGVDPAKGAPCDRGFWLVDEAGRDTPLFSSLRTFLSDAAGYAQAAEASTGAPPELNALRRWAVARLAELAGYGLPPPLVRELDATAAGLAGGH